jgi:hypothetical protein
VVSQKRYTACSVATQLTQVRGLCKSDVKYGAITVHAAARHRHYVGLRMTADEILVGKVSSSKGGMTRPSGSAGPSISNEERVPLLDAKYVGADVTEPTRRGSKSKKICHRYGHDVIS